ncbi:hypothetical protein GIB67_017382 [Kingdonia uniflora]|uniref:Uncharacterized protein n=1 Tax=Kingdonia uniflora TaxID=39325 RepID=A0A7J7M449_9MAGN|nr:hypothetical protein GIB67_017382 [Kingdonia uniflora]
MAGKTLGSMEEKLSTPEINTALKLARLNKMPDRLVDMATASSTVVRNLAKRKAVKRGLLLVLGEVLRPRFEVEAVSWRNNVELTAAKEDGCCVDDEFLKLDANNILLMKLRIVGDKSSRHRVVDLEGLLERGEKSLLNCRMFVYAHSVLRPKTCCGRYARRYWLSRAWRCLYASLSVCFVDLSQLGKAASGSRQGELANIVLERLNKEISDMKCNLHTMNEQLLKREIDLDTARTNLAASEADVEKLSSSMWEKIEIA